MFGQINNDNSNNDNSNDNDINIFIQDVHFNAKYIAINMYLVKIKIVAKLGVRLKKWPIYMLKRFS